MNTAISNNTSVNAIGDNVLASTKMTKPRKKITPKLKLGFRMADAVIEGRQGEAGEVVEEVATSEDAE